PRRSRARPGGRGLRNAAGLGSQRIGRPPPTGSRLREKEKVQGCGGVAARGIREPAVVGPPPFGLPLAARGQSLATRGPTRPRLDTRAPLLKMTTLNSRPTRPSPTLGWLSINPLK